ncbi:MAG TPA: hypothetical protein VN870_00760 [Streptosporangiaceae bacterium]|nr:hypothetical protein [Streptosporangiaceae bacterium]
MNEQQAAGQAAPELSPEVRALVEQAARDAYDKGRKEAADEAMKAQEAQAAKLSGPTHYLYLADGSVEDGTGAIPTHVSRAGDDGDEVLVPVIHAYER